MSAELYCASEPGGNNASLQGTTVGGSKPLHRFIKGQPKIIGIIVLVLGSCFFIISIMITSEDIDRSIYILPGFLQGAMFIVSGILYILTEHNPTKKTVTISLALSIVSILGVCWTLLHVLPTMTHYDLYYDHHYLEDIEDNITNITEIRVSYWSSYAVIVDTTMMIFMFYGVVGVIIFIVMSSLAVTALRSTKSQAIVVMTAAPAETPVE